MYLRSGPDNLQEDWLGQSVPIMMERILLSQPILNNQMDVSIFNLLDNFKFGIELSVIFLLSFVGVFSFSFLLNELTRRIRFGPKRAIHIWKRIRLAANKFRVSRFALSAIGIYFLFVHEFIWIAQLFLTNNVKVEV